MNSDEEFLGNSSGGGSDGEEDYSDFEKEDVVIDLPHDQRNVGKSLRNDLESFTRGKSKVLKRDEVFNEKFQLPLGKRVKRAPAKTEEEDDMDADIDREMEEWLANQSLDDEENEEEEVNEAMGESGPVVIRASSASSSINPKHVRNQRKTEAELMGLRIHLQPLIDISRKIEVPMDNAQQHLGPIRSLYKTMLQLRTLLGQNGSVQCEEQVNEYDKPDLSWEALQAREQALWAHHESVIQAAERRMQLTATSKKTLKAMNRSALEQTEAALARKQEIGAQPGFYGEDQEFYSQLLRDFVSTRSVHTVGTAAATTNKPQQQQQKSRKDYHQSKKDEAKMNYAVHDKLVNFIAPVVLAQPTVDIDQFIKSLFQ